LKGVGWGADGPRAPRRRYDGVCMRLHQVLFGAGLQVLRCLLMVGQLRLLSNMKPT
jgi:hypothetical protein